MENVADLILCFVLLCIFLNALNKYTKHYVIETSILRDIMTFLSEPPLAKVNKRL